MPSHEPGGGPQLTEFVAGYAGPPPVDYRGGKVKVIAAIVYADGIAIEWFMDPVPDLSWLADEAAEGSSSFFPQFQDQPEKIERMRRFKRISTFWDGAMLTDDQGTQYRLAGGGAGGAEEIGYKGRETFSPRPPPDARVLTVRVSDLVLSLTLNKPEN